MKVLRLQAHCCVMHLRIPAKSILLFAPLPIHSFYVCTVNQACTHWLWRQCCCLCSLSCLIVQADLQSAHR